MSPSLESWARHEANKLPLGQNLAEFTAQHEVNLAACGAESQ